MLLNTKKNEAKVKKNQQKLKQHKKEEKERFVFERECFVKGMWSNKESDEQKEMSRFAFFRFLFFSCGCDQVAKKPKKKGSGTQRKRCRKNILSCFGVILLFCFVVFVTKNTCEDISAPRKLFIQQNKTERSSNIIQ